MERKIIFIHFLVAGKIAKSVQWTKFNEILYTLNTDTRDFWNRL